MRLLNSCETWEWKIQWEFPFQSCPTLPAKRWTQYDFGTESQKRGTVPNGCQHNPNATGRTDYVGLQQTRRDGKLMAISLSGGLLSRFTHRLCLP